MIDKNFVKMMNEMVEKLKKDKKFMEFHDKMLKNEDFLNFIKNKEKEEKKECDCYNCKTLNNLIKNIEVEILKSELKTKVSKMPLFDFNDCDIDFAIKRKKEERLKFEKALKEYGKHVLAVDFLTNNKEEGQ